MRTLFKTSTLLLLVGLCLIGCSKSSLQKKFNDDSWGEVYKMLYDLGIAVDDLKIAYSSGLASAYDSNDETTANYLVGGFRGEDKFSFIIGRIDGDKIVDIKDEFVCVLPENSISIQEYGETKEFPLNYLSVNRYLKNDSYTYLSIYNAYEGGVPYEKCDFRLLAKTPSGDRVVPLVYSGEYVNDKLIPAAAHSVIYGDCYYNQNLEMEYTIKDNQGRLEKSCSRYSSYDISGYIESQYMGNYSSEYEKGIFLLTYFFQESNQLAFNAEIVDVINGSLLCDFSTVVVNGDNKYKSAAFNGIDSEGNYKFKVEYVTYGGDKITYDCIFNPYTQAFKEI